MRQRLWAYMTGNSQDPRLRDDRLERHRRKADFSDSHAYENLDVTDYYYQRRACSRERSCETFFHYLIFVCGMTYIKDRYHMLICLTKYKDVAVLTGVRYRLLSILNTDCSL